MQMMHIYIDFKVSVCVFVLSGMLMLLLGFFAFLHCWLNAFAEMLRFADRMFYEVRNLIHCYTCAYMCGSLENPSDGEKMFQ